MSGQAQRDAEDAERREQEAERQPGTMLDADEVLAAIIACAPLNMELRAEPDVSVDREAAAYVEGVRAAHDAVQLMIRQAQS